MLIGAGPVSWRESSKKQEARSQKECIKKSRLEDTADLKLAGVPSQRAGEPPNVGKAGREESAWPTA